MSASIDSSAVDDASRPARATTGRLDRLAAAAAARGLGRASGARPLIDDFAAIDGVMPTTTVATGPARLPGAAEIDGWLHLIDEALPDRRLRSAGHPTGRATAILGS